MERTRASVKDYGSEDIMGWLRAVRGCILCTVWYYSIISGFFILYCPVMYLLLFNHALYRRVADHLFAFWELYPVALFQWCNKLQLHHYGDYVNRNEKAIIVINHRTRVDWNYVWIALYHATQNEGIDSKVNGANNCFINALGGNSKIKLVLKDEIKHVPALGWVMQMNYFLYIKRDWRDDQRSINEFIHYYNDMKTIFRIVLFPEGTDLSENNRHKSDRFALAHKLPCYEYVLHPRTTGWAVLSSQLLDAGLEAVYDVTVAYDTPAQTELDLMKGRIPQNAYFHFKRYSAEELPKEEEQLRNWLNQRWSDKENSLKSFHINGIFVPSSQRRPPRNLGVAKIAFILWNLIDITFLYLICNNSWFQFWVLYHSILLLFVTRIFGGFHNLQYKLLRK